MGPEYYVTVMSFVNQDLLEPGSSVLLHNKVMSVVGILPDDADPLVSVMKVDKAPWSRTQTSAACTTRYRRSRRQSSCHSPIQSCTRR